MFLGDRYGSHVLPSRIPAAEFKIFKNIAMVTGQDTSLLDKWFILDMNAEPAVYQLQPITKHFTYYNDMDPSKEKLHEKVLYCHFIVVVVVVVIVVLIIIIIIYDFVIVVIILLLLL